MRIIQKAGINFLIFEQLGGYPHLGYGISLRGEEGETDFSTHSCSKAKDNTARFCRAVGISAESVVRARQVHGSQITVVREPSDEVGQADALCTNQAGVSLMMFGADCPLIIIYDPQGPALGLAHAGWRGTVGRVTAKLIERMVEEFASNPGEMRAGIGPGICGNCYEVGEEMVEQAKKGLGEIGAFLRLRSTETENGPAKRWFFDLAEANRQQLLDKGLTDEHIELSGCCTYEQGEWFPSYRRDGEKSGRWALLAGLNQIFHKPLRH